MGKRAIESPTAAEGQHLRYASRRSPSLGGASDATVGAECGVRVAPVFEQLERLRKRPCRDLDLMPVLLEQLHKRSQDHHVCGVGQIDPDAHRLAPRHLNRGLEQLGWQSYESAT